MNHVAFDRLIKSIPTKQMSFDQIETIEKKLNIKFTSEQKYFLLKYQGVSFHRLQPVEYQGKIEDFLSFDAIENRYNFLKDDVETEMGIYCYKNHLVPIADTNFYSEFICISISPLFDWGVWSIDYDIDESILPKSDSKAKVFHIADSISEFLSICAANVLES